jgi:hypothetical protein
VDAAVVEAAVAAAPLAPGDACLLGFEAASESVRRPGVRG